MVVEDLEELLIPVGELFLHLGRETVPVGIKVLLELLELELRIRHDLADDLAFPCKREHVDVDLGDHHLDAKRSNLLDSIHHILVLRIVESPVSLDADAVDTDAFFLQHLHDVKDTLKFGRTPYIELVVVELGVRSILLGEAENCLDDLITILLATESVDPALVAVSALFGDDLIDDVPRVYPAFEVGADGLDIAPESLYELIVTLGIALLIIPEEFGSLVVPAQRVSHSEHPMLFGKVDIAVGAFPVPDIRSGMKGLGLEFITRGKRIEMLEDQCLIFRVASAHLKRTDGSTDLEGVLVNILESRYLGWLLRCGSAGDEGNQGCQDDAYSVESFHTGLFNR